jgi:hypothetical protein
MLLGHACTARLCEGALGRDTLALAAAWPDVGLGLAPGVALVAAPGCVAVCESGLAVRLRLRGTHLPEAP